MGQLLTLSRYLAGYAGKVVQGTPSLLCTKYLGFPEQSRF